MSSQNSFGLNLRDLFADLRALAPDLREEAAQIIFANGDKAAEELRAAYPRVTGNLADRVKVTRTAAKFSIESRVTTAAPHASWFENGTEARHYITKKNGVRKLLSAAPAHHVFIPLMVRRRRTMYEALKALVASRGLEVSGDA